MGGKVKGERLLITFSKEEKRLVARAAKAEGEALAMPMPTATYIRRAALFAARKKLDVE